MVSTNCLPITLSLALGATTAAAFEQDAQDPSANGVATSVVTAGTASVRIAPRDTFLNIDVTNYSTNAILATYTWPDYQVANAIVMKFDLSALPADAVIQTATMNLALIESDQTADTGYTVRAHKIVAKNPVISKATGYTVDGLLPWTPNLCCYLAAPLAQADISSAYDQQLIDKTPGYKSWTITPMVQEWLANPAGNFGVLLNSDASKPRDRYRFFASMEHPDVSLRPYLEVTFTAADATPPSVVITAPGSGSTLSGTVTVQANASDNTGVAGVQFSVDGMNLGAEDATPPYSVSWNTSNEANGSHTLLARARDTAGNQAASAPVAVTVDNGVTSSDWSNEPAGLVTYNDHSWDALIANGWNYLRRTSAKDADIVSDPSAPFSPLNVLRIIFTPGMLRDTEPGVHWLGLPRTAEIYTGWWMKLSSNWTCSPAGCGKIAMLFTDEANGPGVTYSNIAGVNGSHYINVATTWPAHGYRFWEPNVTKTMVSDNQWYRVEWYVKWESSLGAADGIVRWWVNGVLNGDYRNVRFPPIRGFIELQYASTRQDPPPTEQYLYIDHTHVSIP